MKKISFAKLLLQSIFAATLVYFALMLYWSSINQEKTLFDIKEQLVQIKKEIHHQQSAPPALTTTKTEVVVTERPHIDPALPNLLEEDPFYEKTLPGMLGKDFIPHGMFHSGTLGKPDNLLPLSNWLTVSTWNGMCSISLARSAFGFYETFCPYGAIKIEERGEQEYWIHLREGVYWEPLKKDFFPPNFNLAETFLERHPVTSHDYKFYFDALMNPYNQESGAVALRGYLDDIEELRVIDDYTFVVKWKLKDFTQADGTVVKKKKYVAKLLTGSLTPLPVHVFQYFADGKKIVEDDSDPNTFRTDSVWAQNYRQHWAKNIIISCGPYIFDGMTDREIKFVKNRNFYNPLMALVEGFKVEFKDSTDNIWQDFKLGINDSHSLIPDELLQYHDFIQSDVYKKQPYRILELEFLMRAYNYIAWNSNNPLFSTKKVRRALTMAIDRQRIINKNLNGMGEEIHGSFFKYSPSTDPSISPWPYDVQAAKRLLEEEGWYDSDGDGIIDKMIDGVRTPFKFAITYYVKNGSSKSVSEYIVSALREIGIDGRLNGVDITDLTTIVEDKTFDALYMGWSLGTPPEDPNQLWSSEWAKEKGSSNIVGFANPDADKIIRQLEFESNPEKRKELYYAFDRIIYDEQPYTFLFSPKTLFLYRNYLQNVFIPADRQDLVPGANVTEPDSSIFWIKR